MPASFNFTPGARNLRSSFKVVLLAAACSLACVTYADQALPLDPSDSWFHFTGDSFLHSFHGEARGITGNAVLNLSATPPIRSAQLAFRTAELTTFNDERDQKMKDWMHVSVHPEIDFRLE